MIRRLLSVLLCSSMLSGCGTVAQIDHVKLAADEAPVVQGPQVRHNATPLDGAMTCFGDKLAGTGRRYAVAVGEIKDYTGKFSTLEGATITQGGALMLYSALGQLSPAIRLLERFDTRIGEAELAFMDRRQLGNGQVNTLDGAPGPGPHRVPWEPYYGGSILESDYYVVGGITEVNWNIQSGGAEVGVNAVGPRARVFTMNIAVDLRIVDTKSLVVVRTATFEKQITGYEIGAGVFRFFGVNLFDIDIGAKNQEPLQLGVRTTLQYAAMDLIGTISRVDYRDCVPAPLATGLGPLAPLPSIPRPPRIPAVQGSGGVPVAAAGRPRAVAMRAPAGSAPLQAAQAQPVPQNPQRAMQQAQPAGNGGSITILPSVAASSASAAEAQRTGQGTAQLGGAAPTLASNLRPM